MQVDIPEMLVRPIHVRIEAQRAPVFLDRSLVEEVVSRPPQEAGLGLMSFGEIRVEPQGFLRGGPGSLERRRVPRREFGHAQGVGARQPGLSRGKARVQRDNALEQRDRDRIVLSILTLVDEHVRA